MIFQGLINTRDGEREYTQAWYCVADNSREAEQYFSNRIREEAGEDAKYQEEGPVRKGYWDSSGETFTYLDYWAVCRGLVIPDVKGSSVYIDFGAENWRKKFNDFKESLVEETQCLDGDEPFNTSDVLMDKMP